MHAPFLVSVRCPECGGTVRYPEGAYTFKCPYCGSVLRIKKDGVDLKYIIPPRILKSDIHLIIKKALIAKKVPINGIRSINQIKIIYKPFWYFKGMVYYSLVNMKGNDTLSKTWYYSFQANPDFVNTFNTLSVRAEVLTLEPFDNEAIKNKGVILPLILDKEEAYRCAESVAEMSLQFETGRAQYKKLYLIGEHFFIIYFPVIQVVCSGTGGYRTFMIDGVGKSLLEDKAGKGEFAPKNNGQ